MKLLLDKLDLQWLNKNGFISPEQVSVVWNQLLQKCAVVPDKINSPKPEPKQEQKPILSVKKTIIPIVPPTNKPSFPSVSGKFFGTTSLKKDICIAYSLNNGSNIAKTLKNALQRRGKKMVSLACEFDSIFDASKVEKEVASSNFLVVVLTEHALKDPEIVFSMLVAKHYYQYPSLVMLVHDAESCPFPGYDEQPDTTKEFFSEKAVTFLNCYPDEGVDEIISKYDTEINALENAKQSPSYALSHFLSKNEGTKEFKVDEIKKRMQGVMEPQMLNDLIKKADKNKNGVIDAVELFDLMNSVQSQSNPTIDQNLMQEDITTRIFLSHKRSTGQSIASRLYEGLKNSYKVFIDNEAKFKIHNLKLIVQSTDVFVIILSYGILLSKWCLEELKSAIENKKKIIIVRELSYSLPAVLPADWKPVEQVLRSSPELVWLAEYNSACVKALCTFTGSPDSHYRHAQQFLKSSEGSSLQESILSNVKERGLLDLNEDVPLPEHLRVDAVIDVLQNFTGQITSLKMKDHQSLTEDIARSIIQKLPNLVNISLHQSVTDQTIEHLIQLCPNIQSLNLRKCNNLTSAALEIVAANLPGLEHLDLGNWSKLTDEDLALLSHACPDLKTLHLVSAKDITDNSLKIVSQNCHQIQELGLMFCTKLTDNTFQILPSFSNLSKITLPYQLYLSSKLDDFKKAHPTVVVKGQLQLVKPSKIICPGLVVDVHLHPSRLRVHIYGHGEEEWIPQEKIQVIEYFKPTYAALSTPHMAKLCKWCDLLHPLLKDVQFNNLPNPYLLNEWYFTTPDSKRLLDAIVNPAPHKPQRNVINFYSLTFPAGLRIDTILTACSTRISLTEPLAVRLPANIDEEDLETILHRCPSIEELVLKQFSPELVTSLINSRICRNIKIFNLEKAVYADDKVLESLVPECPEAETWILEACDSVTDQGVACIATHCPKLRALCMNGCQVTNKSVEILAEKCPCLESLDILLTKISIKFAVETFQAKYKRKITFPSLYQQNDPPLHIAYKKHDKNLFCDLVQLGEDINSRESKEGATVLHKAVIQGRDDYAKLVLELKANPNIHDTRGGSTPLHFAAANNKEDLVALLLDHGADINSQRDDGCTPLHRAVVNYCGHAAIMLVQRGADVGMKNKNGVAPTNLPEWRGATSSL